MKKIIPLLFCLSSPSFACDMAGFSGRWHVVFANYSCQVTVQPSGKIAPGNCQVMARPAFDQPTVTSPARGQLKMQDLCRVTGNFNFTDRSGDKVKAAIGQSRAATGVDTWAGLVRLNRDSETDAYHTFNAVRIVEN